MGDLAELGRELVLEGGECVVGLREGGLEEIIVGLREGLLDEFSKGIGRAVTRLAWVKGGGGCPGCAGGAIPVGAPRGFPDPRLVAVSLRRISRSEFSSPACPMNAIHLTVHPPVGEVLIAQLMPAQYSVGCSEEAQIQLPFEGFA